MGFVGFRAQAGLEYLMTYGWALVLIVTVASVLFFVISSPSSNVSFSSSDPTKILLRASNVSGTNAEIQLQNATGGKINITSITPTGYSNCTINGSNPPLSIGGGSQMKLNCTAPSDNKGSIKIEYTDFAGLSRIVTINASGSSGGTSETGLVAYYKFDEGTGTTTADSSGNGNNGTLLPTGSEPSWQATGCPSGNCLGFDGVNDRVDAADSTSLDVVDNFTLSLWLKPTTVASMWQNPLIKGQRAWSIYLSYDEPYISWNNGGWRSFATTSANIPAGNWSQIVYTRSSPTEAIYVNGVKQAEQGIQYAMLANDSSLWIGGNWEWFNGSIDEVKIYNRALTASEICSVCKEHIPSGGACNCT